MTDTGTPATAPVASTTTEAARVVHPLDDENGFLETASGVRRIKGTGLLRLAAGTTDRAAPPRRRGDTPAEGPLILGPAALTRQLAVVAEDGPGPAARTLDEDGGLEPLLAAPDGHRPSLVLLATASLFDPRTARAAETCVRAGQPHLVYGAAAADVTFAGPLWTPDRAVACYECLRVRVSSNSVHGPVWRAYMRHLAASGGRPYEHEVPSWTSARLAGTVGGRIADWTADPVRAADTLLWHDPTSPDRTERHLPVVPNCAVCAGGPGRETTATGTLGDAVDDRVGIVHAVNVRRAESGPAVYLSGSTSADLSLVKPPMRVTRNGGAGFSKGEALDATLGESLERYAAGFYRQSGLRLSAWSGLDAPAVRPDAFALFSAAQYAEPGFPFAPFEADTPVRWAPATDLTTGDTVLVPASQVYMHYRRVPGESAIAPSISTGLAAGPSYRQAVLSGLSEVVERDALAVSWLHRLPPRPVTPEAVAASSRVSYMIERAASWRVRFHDLSLDLGPSCVVAVMEHGSGADHVMSFGSACRTSPVKAVEKAFLEAAQGLTYVRRLLRQYKDWDVAEDFSDVDDFNKHAILYSKYPALREKAGYLVHPSLVVPRTRPQRPYEPAAAPDGPLTDAPTGPQRDVRDTLTSLVAELRAAGHPVYAVDLTTPDVRRMGVHVVRVLVPGLQHLAGIHGCRMLGGRRLREVVAGLGFDSAPDNPYPHPLP
ncbi:YcaO-like family protein [Streptomyces roseoverticillatus]|uniref:YcaO-like family protein n=1 Tax=Streptomyces roseoverticillatus TaxID=66429 RepID=UPI001F2DC1B2|nr:YcaO-like family protein [Streptomyces roseoverticillatus]MCF3106789.1 YcaO-like family protein [Streptomyces roseoverticillatus]